MLWTIKCSERSKSFTEPEFARSACFAYNQDNILPLLLLGISALLQYSVSAPRGTFRCVYDELLRLAQDALINDKQSCDR